MHSDLKNVWYSAWDPCTDTRSAAQTWDPLCELLTPDSAFGIVPLSSGQVVYTCTENEFHLSKSLFDVLAKEKDCWISFLLQKVWNVWVFLNLQSETRATTKWNSQPHCATYRCSCIVVPIEFKCFFRLIPSKTQFFVVQIFVCICGDRKLFGVLFESGGFGGIEER